MASPVLPDLYISDLLHAQSVNPREYDRVITVCRASVDVPQMMKHETYELWDDYAEQQSLFDDAVNAVRHTRSKNEKLLVHCVAGQSRSPAVVTTALAADWDVAFEDAWNTVHDARPSIQIHPALRAKGKTYLDE